MAPLFARAADAWIVVYPQWDTDRWRGGLVKVA